MATVSLSAFVSSTSRSAYVIAGCVTAAAAAVILCAALGIQVWLVDDMAHDTFILLDGAWRIEQGQKPHTDFYTPLGPYPLYLAAFGLRWLPSMRSLVIAEAGLFVWIVFIAFYVGGHRFSALLTCLLALHLGLIVMAPRSLGLPWPHTSFAMLYNRQAEALLAIFLIIWLIPRRNPSTTGSLGAAQDGAVAAVCLVLLGWIKINYLGIALAAMILGLWMVRSSKPLWISFLLWCTILAGVMSMAVSPGDMIADILRSLRSQEPGQRHHLFREMLQFNLPILLLLVLGLLWPFIRNQAIDRPHRIRGAVLFTFFALSGFALCATNMQNKDIVLLGLAPLALLPALTQTLEAPTADDNTRGRVLFALCLSLVVAGSLSFKDAYSLAYCWHWDRYHAAEVSPEQRFHADLLADMAAPNDDYTPLVNDGIDLLRRNDVRGRLLVFEFANPFAFALRLPSPRGDALWWHAGKTFTASVHPPAQQVFREVDAVLVPQKHRDTDSKLMVEVYGSYLELHFVQVDASERWILWKRR